MNDRTNPTGSDAFGGFDLESGIRSRAASCGIDLSDTAVKTLAWHARAVLEHNDALHLTSITDPTEFVDRHLGESFEGAAMLGAEIEGQLLDLGSGNGYPGVALAIARPGLRPVLAEAALRKAEFLRTVVESAFAEAAVLDRQIQRAADLGDAGPFRVLASRATGGWDRVVPRLATSLARDGEVLLWAGSELETIQSRSVWRRLRLEERRALPGRDRSWIWRFSVNPPAAQ